MSLDTQQQGRLLELTAKLSKADRLDALDAKEHEELALLLGRRDRPGLFQDRDVYCQLKKRGCFGWIAPGTSVFFLENPADGIIPGNIRNGCRSCSIAVKSRDQGPTRLGTDPEFNRQLG